MVGLGTLGISAFSRYHRMVGVGRDLCGSSTPTPLPKAGSPRVGCTGPCPGRS